MKTLLNHTIRAYISLIAFLSLAFLYSPRISYLKLGKFSVEEIGDTSPYQCTLSYPVPPHSAATNRFPTIFMIMLSPLTHMWHHPPSCPTQLNRGVVHDITSSHLAHSMVRCTQCTIKMEYRDGKSGRIKHESSQESISEFRASKMRIMPSCRSAAGFELFLL